MKKNRVIFFFGKWLDTLIYFVFWFIYCCLSVHALKIFIIFKVEMPKFWYRIINPSIDFTFLKLDFFCAMKKQKYVLWVNESRVFNIRILKIKTIYFYKVDFTTTKSISPIPMLKSVEVWMHSFNPKYFSMGYKQTAFCF